MLEGHFLSHFSEKWLVSMNFKCTSSKIYYGLLKLFLQLSGQANTPTVFQHFKVVGPTMLILNRGSSTGKVTCKSQIDFYFLGFYLFLVSFLLTFEYIYTGLSISFKYSSLFH